MGLINGILIYKYTRRRICFFTDVFTLSVAPKLFQISAGVEFRRGVNPLKDRLKLDNFVTRAMWVVMKLVRVASNRHLRNWEAPDALVQEITPSGELNG